MYRIVLVLLCIAFAAGCSTTKKIHVPKSGVTVIDFGAERRGSYLYQKEDGSLVLVSEPAPDAAMEITASLGLSAGTIGELVEPNLKAEYANRVVDLAGRSQTLQVLRESLFRLSEMGASTDLSTAERIELYTKVLDTVRLIAATEFGQRSGASQEVIDMTLKDFLSDTATGTVPLPND